VSAIQRVQMEVPWRGSETSLSISLEQKPTRAELRLPFTAHEFRVLRYFIDNPGRVICRHELLDKV
jgi:DNA-binding response OmpR family regulator